jgi:hypothetical protein
MLIEMEEAIDTTNKNPLKSNSLLYTLQSRHSLLEFNGLINNQNAKILFDTGATHNFIAQQFINKHHITTKPTSSTLNIQLAVADSRSHTNETAEVQVQLGQYKDNITCHVINSQMYDIIIGMEWFRTKQPLVKWLPPYTLIVKGSDGTTLHINDTSKNKLVEVKETTELEEESSELFLTNLQLK